MSQDAGPKEAWDGDPHLEMPPWEFVLTYLNRKERRFIRALLQHGDHRQAIREARFTGEDSLQEVLSRPRVKVAIHRCAWLAKDPVVGAKMALPLVMERQLEVALTAKDKTALSAVNGVTAMSGLQPAQKRAILKADLTRELLEKGEERPWVDKTLPWRNPRKAPSLLPSEAAERPAEEIERAADEAVRIALREDLDD